MRALLEADISFRSTILDYAQAFLTQVSATAAVNAHYRVDERLARWLLLARDRADADELFLTHDFIAQMLGVRRAGVTLALQKLEHDGVIEGGRGLIRIADRDGLRRRSNGAYTRADEVMQYRAS